MCNIAPSNQHHVHACFNGWLPSCLLITNTVIIITITIIIMITVILIVILSSLAHQAHSVHCIQRTYRHPPTPPPAVFSTGGRINIHLGPYTGLLSDGVSGRAVWRLRTQWPTNESRETKHSYTPRASKDHPFNTNTHMRRACRAGRWAERESGGGVGRKNERITDGCWERWGHREVKEQWNPQAHGEEGACNFTQHLSAFQHVFVSCAVLHFEKLTQSVRAPFYPFSQDGHIQQGSRSLCEHPHVPVSGTLKFVNTHRVAKTIQQKHFKVSLFFFFPQFTTKPYVIQDLYQNTNSRLCVVVGGGSDIFTLCDLDWFAFNDELQNVFVFFVLTLPFRKTLSTWDDQFQKFIIINSVNFIQLLLIIISLSFYFHILNYYFI